MTGAHPAVRGDGVLIRLLGRPEILGVDGPLAVDSTEACPLLTRIALNPNEIVLTGHELGLAAAKAAGDRNGQARMHRRASVLA